MRQLSLIFLMSSMCLGAASQKYQYKDPKITDEFTNVYKYLNYPAKDIQPTSFTKTQILSMVPNRAGIILFCSDCSTDAVVISTGTGTGAFSRLTARTTAIN